MGFYGSVYYQLIETFYKLIAKNSGKDSKNFPATIEDGELVLPANGRKGVINLDSGNRWISFAKDDDKIVVWHNSPDSDEESLSSFTSFEKVNDVPEGQEITELGYGNTFSVNSMKYDAAGHINNKSTQYFKLPEAEVNTKVESLEDIIIGENKDLDSFKPSYPTGVTNIYDYVVYNKNQNDTYHGYVGKWEKPLDFSSITEAIGDMNNIPSNFDNNKYSISEAIIDLKVTTNDIEDNINNLTDRTEGLEGTSKNFGARGEYGTVYTEIGNLYTKIDAEKSNLQAEITKEKSNLQTEINTVNTTLQGSITSLQDNLTSNVNTLNASITNISDKHTTDYQQLNKIIGTQPEDNANNIFTRLANADTSISQCATKAEVENTYATKTEVENTYITKTEVENSYVNKDRAQTMQEDINIRIKEEIANERFLSKEEAAKTYDVQGAAQEVKIVLSSEIDNLQNTIGSLEQRIFALEQIIKSQEQE